MTYKKTALTLCMIGSVLLFENCSKKDNVITSGTPVAELVPTLPATPLNYNITYPAYLTGAMAASNNTPASNAITNDGATLGRVLFYDKRLSKNNTISCASCHKSTASFSDEARLSTGFEGGLTARHSMPLLNIAFYRSGRMFWDERSATLEDQVLQPIQDHVEMGITIPEMVTKVQTSSFYPTLFQKAFGSTSIDSIKISKALAQFVRSIIPYQSKYDRVKQNLDVFTAAEAAGENLFLNAQGPPLPGQTVGATCANCHTPPLFITSDPIAGFGLNDPNDLGINNSRTFKSSTLRNIVETAPYFHNGSVASLQAMLTSNIPAHRVAPPDVQNLLAFMRTLSDPVTVAEERFADPFR